MARCLERLAAEPGVQVAALESSISRELTLPEGVVRIRDTYPMARYLRAFDLTVAAAGYNAFHELLHLGVPTLFVPMPRELDDQGARARWAQRMGAGLAVEGPDAPDLDRQARRAARPGRARADLGARDASSEAPTAPSRPPARSRTSRPSRRR